MARMAVLTLFIVCDALVYGRGGPGYFSVPREENAQDWSCEGPGHLLWCHMSPVMVLGIRKAVLGIFPQDTQDHYR